MVIEIKFAGSADGYFKVPENEGQAHNWYQRCTPYIVWKGLNSACFSTVTLIPYLIELMTICLCYMDICHHGMESLRVADGGDGLRIWRAARNVLHKQSRTADKGWSYSFRAGGGTKYRKK